jgi:hypothetical protein
VKATKKKPRAKAGLKLNEVERMKGTDWLRARPPALIAGSRVDRNACLNYSRWCDLSKPAVIVRQRIKHAQALEGG